MKESNMGYNEVINLPYAVFLSLLKQFYILRLEETEEGREILREANVLNKSDNFSEPDWSRLRGLKGYKKQNIKLENQEE